LKYVRKQKCEKCGGDVELDIMKATLTCECGPAQISMKEVKRLVNSDTFEWKP